MALGFGDREGLGVGLGDREEEAGVGETEGLGLMAGEGLPSERDTEVGVGVDLGEGGAEVGEKAGMKKLALV